MANLEINITDQADKDFLDEYEGSMDDYTQAVTNVGLYASREARFAEMKVEAQAKVTRLKQALNRGLTRHGSALKDQVGTNPESLRVGRDGDGDPVTLYVVTPDA